MKAIVRVMKPACQRPKEEQVQTAQETTRSQRRSAMIRVTEEAVKTTSQMKKMAICCSLKGLTAASRPTRNSLIHSSI